MTYTNRNSGKIEYYVLCYIFPNNVEHTEKCRNKKKFKSRVAQLKRYQKIGVVAELYC